MSEPQTVSARMPASIGTWFAVAFLSWFGGEAFTASPIPCKYSVRDVAFVNVHGKSWQLTLIKPADVDDATFERWNSTLKRRLRASNLGWMWVDIDSEPANRLVDSDHVDLGASPIMFVSRHGSSPKQVAGEPGQSFDSRIESVVVSRARSAILEQVVDSLCVVVLIESKSHEANERGRSAVGAAIDKMNKQMWLLEKATEKGPALVTISQREAGPENWLLYSLGIHKSNLPQVAIVYGQGRRLGSVLSGQEILVDPLVRLMQICGQNCECSLNRDWLYENQLLHVWDRRYERAAENSLNFDPKSNFVIAEVAQILQKNSANEFDPQSIELGGGLVIHDLDGESNDRDRPLSKSDRSVPTTSDNQRLLKDIPAAPSTGTVDDRADTDIGSLPIPWPLLLVMALAVLIGGGMLVRKARH